MAATEKEQGMILPTKIMSSATDGVRITTGFAYPPFAANQNTGTTSTGNPYFQQPCPAAAASSSGPRPVLDHIITVTGQLSPTMVVIQGGTGEILAIEDGDQDIIIPYVLYEQVMQTSITTNCILIIYFVH